MRQLNYLANLSYTYIYTCIFLYVHTRIVFARHLYIGNEDVVPVRIERSFTVKSGEGACSRLVSRKGVEEEGNSKILILFLKTTWENFWRCYRCRYGARLSRRRASCVARRIVACHCTSCRGSRLPACSRTRPCRSCSHKRACAAYSGSASTSCNLWGAGFLMREDWLLLLEDLSVM